MYIVGYHRVFNITIIVVTYLYNSRYVYYDIVRIKYTHKDNT